MDLKLKICGMREPDNLSRIEALQPDYLGLIFYRDSPRYVSEEIEILEPGIKITGVFVNASEEEILEKSKNYNLAAVQLHGEESPEFCENLKDHFSRSETPLEIIKVFGMKEVFNFDRLKPYEDIVDFFLFDTRGKNKGGNGITFDWDLLKEYPSSTPFFLSGGIGLEEIAAIKLLYSNFKTEGNQDLFYGIDVNSKFETAPAVKDAEALKIFRERLYN
ncbi:phosphoribosylanthranilate isomerase [Salinimicrobium sediminilitoris]|uniref:phosphoribosylanthranilate isomerase n=1 Tax=Salinimicrobium sediminilitoris TaxID=2876715 RepID=UPI001E46B35D|nr:phosphoribosylanthranilate isomerase [Salinimicrobium sediminilitoris]MCC8360709.1 phosphoribosylanthranilate isomerase [Salinimicrobium sediminilitoris]